MAFTYGFFNAKNLDRVYTAEHFTSYLSSIICDGIQDTYGECFSITPAGGFQLRIGSGKAWIQGHYFQNDNGYILDLSQYADSSLPRYVTVDFLRHARICAERANRGACRYASRCTVYPVL